MLDHFYRAKSTRLKAYRLAQESHDYEHLHRFDAKIAEFIAERKRRKEGTGTNPKHFRSKKAHGLLEIRKISTLKRF